MTAPAPTRTGLTVLDTHITRALAGLRAARSTAAGAGSREDRDAEQRAEAHLNALLDYRSAAQRR